MDITYGIKISDVNDPYILNAEEALSALAQGGTPGNFWVDQLPILKYVPGWMPGAGFKRKAEHWRKVNISVSEKPFQYVKESLVSCVVPPVLSQCG
jgi:hypothetical protein